MNRNIWLTATYIKSKDNELADAQSRLHITDLHWQLNINFFHTITLQFGQPSIDLFASRTNTQLRRYVSYTYEREAQNTDAFTICWTLEFPYIFPPFAMIARVLRKVEADKCPKAIIVTPKWPSQPWYPDLLRMSIRNPISFGPSKQLLSSAFTKNPHPLYRSLQLQATLISGLNSRNSH